MRRIAAVGLGVVVVCCGACSGEGTAPSTTPEPTVAPTAPPVPGDMDTDMARFFVSPVTLNERSSEDWSGSRPQADPIGLAGVAPEPTGDPACDAAWTAYADADGFMKYQAQYEYGDDDSYNVSLERTASIAVAERLLERWRAVVESCPGKASANAVDASGRQPIEGAIVSDDGRVVVFQVGGVVTRVSTDQESLEQLDQLAEAQSELLHRVYG